MTPTRWFWLAVAGCGPLEGPVSPLVPAPVDGPAVAEAPGGRPRSEPWSGGPRVVVDEVLPGNASISMDERGEFEDWIDLYNPGAEAVDLAGWGLADDDHHPDWTFPAGTTVAPRGHVLVWADGQVDQGPTHATLTLDRDGDSVFLFDPHGDAVDGLTWPALPDDVVFGRFPSGGTLTAPSIRATPLNDDPVDPGLSLDPSDALFPPADVVRIDLFLDDEGHDALARDSYAVVPAGVAFEGAFLYPVGLTIKGGWGSRRSIDQKAAFRVNLDAFVPGLRLRGQEDLTLNNMVQDDTNVHEMLAWSLMREAGVPAPRVTHVELWMNGEYRGLYLNVETPDDQFLQRWFADPRGNLYEGAYGVDLRDSDIGSFEHDEQGPDDVTDRSDLQALADFLEGPRDESAMPELERRVNLDRTLRAMAAEVVLAHWDGYFYSANNYRLYHEPSTDQWTLLPWGLDQTFASTNDPWDETGLLASFCLDIPSCRTRYDITLAELSQRLLAFDCPGRVAPVLPQIVPLYDADPFKESDLDAMEEHGDETMEFCETWPADVLHRVFE